jgi:hypothetical protein
MDGNPRPRNGIGGTPRPSNESRRPPGAPAGPPSSVSSATASSGMSRAERFDDERRRITESCFAKLDDQGQRTYTTFVLEQTSPCTVAHISLALLNSSRACTDTSKSSNPTLHTSAYRKTRPTRSRRPRRMRTQRRRKPESSSSPCGRRAECASTRPAKMPTAPFQLARHGTWRSFRGWRTTCIRPRPTRRQRSIRGGRAK